MKAGVVIAIVAAVAAGAGLGMHPEFMRRVASGMATGHSSPSTGAALSAAGVHKCQGSSGVLYVDHACPEGTRELAANGGTVNVMSLPKPKPRPAPAAASGSRLVQGMSPEEVDRMRDRMIEDAANR